jgi:hypothetical protein
VSKGAHGCEEQWHARDTRVYTGLGLRVDKNPMSCVRLCIMIHWVETPSPPPLPSIGQRGRVYKEDPSWLLLYVTETLSLLT